MLCPPKHPYPLPTRSPKICKCFLLHNTAESFRKKENGQQDFHVIESHMVHFLECLESRISHAHIYLYFKRLTIV